MCGKARKSNQAPCIIERGGSRREQKAKATTVAPPERPQQPWPDSPRPGPESRKPISLWGQMAILKSDGDEQGECSGVLSTHSHLSVFLPHTCSTWTYICIYTEQDLHKGSTDVRLPSAYLQVYKQTVTLQPQNCQKLASHVPPSLGDPLEGQAGFN